MIGHSERFCKKFYFRIVQNFFANSSNFIAEISQALNEDKTNVIWWLLMQYENEIKNEKMFVLSRVLILKACSSRLTICKNSSFTSLFQAFSF